MSDLLTAVTTAVDAVRDHFAGKPVAVISDGAGGAFVTVEDVEVGPSYSPSVTWLGFQISAAYPSADVYPPLHRAPRSRRRAAARSGHPAGDLAEPDRDAAVPAL